MKYKNFRLVARVVEVLAWVAGVGIFVMGLITGFTGDGAQAIIVGLIFGIVGGFMTFIALYALAQFIYVMLDIERNTRATVKALYEEVEKEDEVQRVATKEAVEGE
jgi:uncharacterized membrane protein